MNTETTEKVEETQLFNVSKFIGYILLVPPSLSVILFLAQLFSDDKKLNKFLFSIWTGDYTGNPGGGGFTSALPFYFGLMAIAGAYLIKDNKR
jgi:hypothetical protein